jgi:hypothetical protein
LARWQWRPATGPPALVRRSSTLHRHAGFAIMLRRIVKIALRILAVLVMLAGIVLVVSWKSPKYYTPSGQYDPSHPIIHFKDYQLEHPRPYIVRGDRYVLFGASHTRDPDEPEIAQIVDEWNKLRPTVALVEGRLGFLLPPFMDPVKNLGEGGKVKELASEHDVPLYNWDLPKEVLASRLKGIYTPEQIALAQILNPYFSNLRFGKPESPEDFIGEYLKRASHVGRQDNFRSAADVDRAWKKQFPGGPDWRDVSDAHGLPGYLGEMSAVNNDLRNQHLVTVVKELLAKGERVFAIMGSSHAVCVAPSFTSR